MAKPTYEDALDFIEAQDIKLYNYQKEMIKLFWENKDVDHLPLFDEVIKSFQTSRETREPMEGQLIYVSSADMFDNPFIKMIKEYLKENENDIRRIT